MWYPVSSHIEWPSLVQDAFLHDLPEGRCSPSTRISSDLIRIVCLKHRHTVQLEALCLWWSWIEIFNRNTCLALVDHQAFAVWIPLEVWGAAGGCGQVQIAYYYLHMKAVFRFCAQEEAKPHILCSVSEYKDGRKAASFSNVLCYLCKKRCRQFMRGGEMGYVFFQDSHS